MSAPNRRIKSLHDFHVFLHIAAGRQGGAEAAAFLGVVEVGHDDEHACALGDVIEADFPPWRFAARALGGDHQLYSAVGGLQGLGRGGDQVGGLLAVDGNAAQPAHDRAKGRLEQAGFADPIHIQAKHKGHHQGEGQVPVAGVRRGNQHALFSTGGQAALNLPALDAQERKRQAAQGGVDHRRGENCSLHVGGEG